MEVQENNIINRIEDINTQGFNKSEQSTNAFKSVDKARKIVENNSDTVDQADQQFKQYLKRQNTDALELAVQSSELRHMNNLPDTPMARENREAIVNPVLAEYQFQLLEQLSEELANENSKLIKNASHKITEGMNPQDISKIRTARQDLGFRADQVLRAYHEKYYDSTDIRYNEFRDTFNPKLMATSAGFLELRDRAKNDVSEGRYDALKYNSLITLAQIVNISN